MLIIAIIGCFAILAIVILALILPNFKSYRILRKGVWVQYSDYLCPVTKELKYGYWERFRDEEDYKQNLNTSFPEIKALERYN